MKGRWIDGGASVESGDGNQSGIHRPSETLRPRSRTVPPRFLFASFPFPFLTLSTDSPTVTPPSQNVLPTVQESSSRGQGRGRDGRRCSAKSGERG